MRRLLVLAALFAAACVAQPMQYVDCYTGTLGAGYTSGGTSLTITSATSTAPCTAVLPNGASFYYLMVRAEAGNTDEVFLVTNRSGTTLTVVGAQASRNASNHSNNAPIIASIMTAAAYSQLLLDAIAPATIDHTTGDFVTTGGITACYGSGLACGLSLPQGAAPPFSQPNTFTLYAPTSISLSYQWQVPSSDPGAGVIASDGGARPSKLSVKALQGNGSKVASTSTISGIGVTVCTDSGGALTTTGCPAGPSSSFNDESPPFYVTMAYDIGSGAASCGWGAWTTNIATLCNFENNSNVVVPVFQWKSNSTNTANLHWYYPSGATSITSVTIEGEESGFTASTSPTWQVQTFCYTNMGSISLNTATTTGGTFSASGSGGTIHAVTFTSLNLGSCTAGHALGFQFKRTDSVTGNFFMSHGRVAYVHSIP